LNGARKPLARLEQWMRPRWPKLAGVHMLRPLSPLVFFMGLLIALPIPFGNVAPAFALIAVSLGVLTRDGVAVGAGMVMAGLSVLVCAGLAFAGLSLAQNL
ncbi:MAG TPA: exopolysaccharide biosynthesis protein, partial [Azospirillaceae bacterium]|nr:exopolysaccharide biosynthesis protein [Azospirillaceae bacterium]